MAIALAELQRPLDIQDYLNAPEDGERFEIINGGMFEVPSPGPKHIELGLAILYAFNEVVKPQKLGKMYVAPLGTRFSENDILEPDVMFISTSQRSSVTAKYLDAVPEFVAEILSPSSRKHDLVTKMAIYQRCGVREYWVVDPIAHQVRPFRLRDGRLVEEAVVAGVVQSEVVTGVTINVKELFAELW